MMASRKKSLKFECPVCYNVILPTVYQCRNCHLICGDCVDRCNTCPTCRVPMPTSQDGRIRNLELEKIILGQVYPCPHKGCKNRIKADEYTEHKLNCLDREAKFCSLLRIHGSSSCPEMKLIEWMEHVTKDAHRGNVQIHYNRSGDRVTFIRSFNAGYEGAYMYISLAMDRSGEGEMEAFPVIVVETISEDGFIYWSPIMLTSPSFAARFVFDIKIHPENLAGSSKPDPGAPVIHFKGVVPHCPESSSEAWSVTDDPSATLNHLKKLANFAFVKYKATSDRYVMSVRLYDKNAERFYQLECLDDDKDCNKGDAGGNESDSKTEISSRRTGSALSSPDTSTSSSSARLRRSSRLSSRPFRSARRRAGYYRGMCNPSDSESLSEFSEPE